MEEFYDIEIDSQVELENGKTLGKLEESKISVNDGNCSSGGWPADLPKPSVGGYGYTEQGEQTVITWDGGDKEEGEFKLSELTPQKSDMIGGTISVIVNGELSTTTISEDDFYDFPDGAGFSIGDNGYVEILYKAFREYHSPGIYFYYDPELDGYCSEISFIADTIHKIDEKYLPEAGGAMVVNMTVDASLHVTSPLTPEEVVTAMQSMPVYCVLESPMSTSKFCGLFMMKISEDGIIPVLKVIYQGDDTVILSGNSNGWVFGI